MSLAAVATGLRHFPHFESSDVDDVCSRISRVLKPHSLVPTGERGRVKAVMNLARFGGIGMGTIDFGGGMQVEAEAGSTYYVMILCAQGSADAQLNGESLQMNSVHGVMGEPGWWFKAKFSGDCEQLVIRIDESALTQHTGAKPRFARGVDLRRPELLPWLQQIERIATSPMMIESLQKHSLSGVSMERLLISLLMTGQPWGEASVRPVRTAAPRCVRKAESFIEEHAGEPLRLSDISGAAGVPPRTLHDGFRRFRDYTPMQFLSNVRLERVRKSLQNATPDTHVVSVAMEWGFVHLGRFAKSYRERFSETPSATLKRAVSR